MEDLLIWVDENDNEIGYGEKMETHKKGQLHRAFSIFIFDWTDATMLLQRRAHEKYHSGGLWSNACCSHPRKGESMDTAINLRLETELGLKTNCHIVDSNVCGLLMDGGDVIYGCGSFQYSASFGELSENEMDHVFLYSPDFGGFRKQDFSFNPDEIEDAKWISIKELNQWMEERLQDFTAWFQTAFDLAYDVLCRQARDRDMFFNFRSQG